LGGVFGQDEERSTRPAQITLISPLGTNGLNSPQVDNIISLNIIAGYAGGVKGFEIGGFANAIKKDMHGLQIAGFGNLVNGKTSGGQVAGFMNLNMNTTNGAQIAGFMNFSKSNMIGTQLAGFTNMNMDSTNAAQVAGFMNMNKGSSKGAQIAGFANIGTEDLSAAQISGFANIANGNVKGTQIAGFLNLTKNDMDGLQLGVVNYAKNIKGAQIAVFNVADSIENGLAFGVFSFVKKGYKAFELAGSESIHGILSFKTGTHKFYNIVSLGTNFTGVDAWALGYGFGTLLPLNQRMGLSLEANSFHLNENEIWTSELNMLNKLSANLSFDLGEKFSVFGGASWNVAVSELKDNEGNVIGSALIPWHTFDKTYNKVNVKQYPGFMVGLRMKI